MSNELKDFKNMILFVDMPNLGGGTTFFVDCIIKRYSPKTTFLIARNFDGNVQLSINNQNILPKTYNPEEIKKILNGLKPSISKIFVNHIIGHTKSFLKHLFTLGKEVTGITHDYLLIFNKPQFTYDQIIKKKYKLQPKIDINQFDRLFTQNIGNMYIYQDFMSTTLKKSVSVIPLPDYYKTLERVSLSDSDGITVGILGFISDIKGKKIVKEFIRKTKNTNVKLVIFGHIDCDYDEKYEYKGIHHLNNLLKKHKPNVLIETSICPETYSYTLTLAMITKLPIVYYKKPIPSVVSNRLKEYTKSVEVSSVDQMIDQVKHVKQNYFYTIDTDMKYDKEWTEYFG